MERIEREQERENRFLEREKRRELRDRSHAEKLVRDTFESDVEEQEEVISKSSKKKSRKEVRLD